MIFITLQYAQPIKEAIAKTERNARFCMRQQDVNITESHYDNHHYHNDHNDHNYNHHDHATANNVCAAVLHAAGGMHTGGVCQLRPHLERRLQSRGCRDIAHSSQQWLAGHCGARR